MAATVKLRSVLRGFYFVRGEFRRLANIHGRWRIRSAVRRRGYAFENGSLGGGPFQQEQRGPPLTCAMR
jgi:hypothetical protein